MSTQNPSRRAVVGGLAATGLAIGTQPAAAQGAPVRVGELNSYSRMAAFAVPYRNALQLAQDEINRAGGLTGLGGRPLEIVFRDDGSSPGDAVRVAEELVTRENVTFIAGAFLSNVGLALADFANQRKILYLATEPLTDALTMASGNRFTYRVRANTYMQTKMLVEAAKGKGVKRWAIVAPNYEYGQSAAANFKKLMAAAVPGFEVVGEQFPALGRVDAGATVGALLQMKPDGIFNVLFGADLPAFVREGNTRGLFEGRTVVSLLTGEPEYIMPLGEETPEGWIVTGYPWEQIETNGHKAFVEAYRARFNDTPRLGSLLGYVVGYMIRDLFNKARSTETEALLAALKGLKSDTVAGPVVMREVDHQSTLGAWVGETTLKGKTGTMKNWSYQDGAKFMFPEAEVLAARKA
ncbi:ABC transporter substrate-binding protein [Phreatobacter sp. AB_2022a]|uniref:ABC transporter substrate-binding protein n=1 Tax=Phreatobacter sp. AB_2022a TaxID=3003134 RepID=UPI0022876BE6|nr:ABC transporter substrate-binding protein [Phreatobacter sp. AB_2022a]MCZ0733716.1 ABC transporter substrate-binding protein [Phreatobacter sp. AB_2022a]